MEITFKFDDSNISKLQQIISIYYDKSENEINLPTDVKPNLSEYSQLYLSHIGLTELAMNEFFQGSQVHDVRILVEKVRQKIVVFNNEKGDVLLQRDPQRIALTNCNLNARLMVANNFLVNNGKQAFTFLEGWEKVLRNNGTLPNMVNSVTNDMYRALLSDIVYYTVVTERLRSNFKKFILDRPNQLIRVWTVGNGTHATMLYYDGSVTYCIDTGVKSRNKIISIENLTSLHGRNIDHLECLET